MRLEHALEYVPDGVAVLAASGLLVPCMEKRRAFCLAYGGWAFGTGLSFASGAFFVS